MGRHGRATPQGARRHDPPAHHLAEQARCRRATPRDRKQGGRCLTRHSLCVKAHTISLSCISGHRGPHLRGLRHRGHIRRDRSRHGRSRCFTSHPSRRHGGSGESTRRSSSASGEPLFNGRVGPDDTQKTGWRAAHFTVAMNAAPSSGASVRRMTATVWPARSAKASRGRMPRTAGRRRWSARRR